MYTYVEDMWCITKLLSDNPENTRHMTDAGLMLGHVLMRSEFAKYINVHLINGLRVFNNNNNNNIKHLI